MITIRSLADDELALLQPLFLSVFGTPISLDLLQWKYARGRGSSWTIWQQNNLLLHCGVCWREVLLQGNRLRVAQLTDLMAAPKQSGLSRHEAPFTQLMHQLLAQLNLPDNPDAVAFGFPSARAMRLGEHAGVYCAVDHWMGLGFLPRQLRWGPRIREISTWSERDRAAVQAFWVAMQADMADFVVGVRDMAYVEHRYLKHPDKSYRLLMVESCWRRQPIGLVVVGPGQGEFELLDVICAWNDVPDALLAAQRWLHDIQGRRLTLNLTSHFAERLSKMADSCEPTDFKIMANPFSPQSTLQKLKHRWWLTGGDTDYR
jgi:hypothetical protein